MEKRPDSGTSVDSFVENFDLNKKLNYMFHCVCFFVASLMVGRCVWLFIQDEDVTQVEYKEFHADEESFYPSFTFCFTNPILYPEHFGQFGEEYTEKEQELIANWSTLRQEYHNYLNGKKTEENKELFANVDYDKMTQSLENYMELEAGLGPKRDEPGRGAEYKTYTRVRWAFRNKTQILGAAYRQKKNDKGKKYNDYLSEEDRSKIPMVDYYISFRTHNVKCYSFNIPFFPREEIFSFAKIFRFRLEIDPELLHQTCLYWKPYVQKKMVGVLGIPYVNDSRTYPKFHNWFDHHTILFHYPNQKITTNFFTTEESFSSEITWSKYYTRMYFVANVEVLKRRNKMGYPCIEGNYDKEVVQRSIEKFGCAPPKFKSGNETPDCSSNEQNLEFEDWLYRYVPCQSLESMSEWHSEQNATDWLLSRNKKNKRRNKPLVAETFAHEIWFRDEKYKELTHHQSLNWESLIGNTGGYIGNFQYTSKTI